MIPVQQAKADMSDPEQHLGWALASIPPMDFNPEMPAVVFPLPYIPWFSKFLWMCGFRHHPELQEIVQQVDESAPLRNAGVQWVRREDADETPRPGVDLTALSDEEAAALLEALQERIGHGDSTAG